jgi:alkylation response protein AidB-like acyl-CoA dehydrogenase
MIVLQSLARKSRLTYHRTTGVELISKMLDFRKTEEQILIEQSIERMAQDFYDSGQHGKYVNSPSGFSDKVWSVLSDSGLFTLPISEASGGAGSDNRDLTVFMQALGKAVFVEPVLFGPVLGGKLLENLGSEKQIASNMGSIITGSSLTALAHLERDARFQLDYVETTFQEDQDSFKLTGKKVFVLAAAMAGKYIVSAIPTQLKGVDKKRRQNIRFFLVDAKADGIFRQDYRLADGSIACDLELRQVSAEAMPGSWEDFENTISKVKVAACAEMVGIMERLFEDTLEYVKTREQFGQALGKFQVIQHRLADQFATLELCRSHLHRISDANPADLSGQSQIAGSKAFISTSAVDLAEEAVQLHGGMGITDELVIGRGLKRIWVLASLFGNAAAERQSFSIRLNNVG